MIFLTILNTVAILIIFFKIKIINIIIKKDKTFWSNILTGYYIWINGFCFRIPIRNKRKSELNDEIKKINENPERKKQFLTATFSWLRTWEEVKQFEKDYKVVDEKIVQNLVNNFVPKK